MPKYERAVLRLPIELDRSDTELMAALQGEKGDPGQSLQGDRGVEGPKGKDSFVAGPKGDKGDSIRGERGDKGEPSSVMGPRGNDGPLPSDEHIMRLIRKVMQGL